MEKNITKKERFNPKHPFHDYIVLFILFAYLFIDFLPGFKSSNTAANHFLYVNILNILVASYLFYFRKIYSISIPDFFNKNFILKTYFAFLIFCVVSFVAANNLSLSILRFSQLLIVCIAIFNITCLLFHKKYLFGKIIFLVSIIAFFQSAKVLLQLESLTDKNLISSFFRAGYLKGNTGNVNIFTVSVLYKIPFILLGITYSESVLKKWFYAFALFSSLAIVFMINARATLISLLLILIVFFIYYFSQKSKLNNRKINSLFFIAPLLLSFLFVNYLFSQKPTKGRYSSTIERVKKITPDGSNARILMWKNAIEITKNNPLFGVGIGNWVIESIPYEPPVNKNISLNAHNDFFEILAETGFLNGIIYALLFIALFIINLKRIIFPRDDISQKIALLAIMILIVYATDAFFNFPLYKPSIQIAFALGMVFTLINLPDQPQQTYNKNKSIVLLVLFALAPLYISIAAYKSSVLELKIRSEFRGKIDLKSKSTIDVSTIINHKPKIPNILLSSTDPFDFYTGIIYVKEKKYDSAKYFLEKADHINPHLGYSKLFLHLIAKHEGNEDDAYAYLKNAFYSRARDLEMYELLLKEALAKNDSTEILNAYLHFNGIHQNPKALEEAVKTLLSVGYPVSKTTALFEVQKKLVKSKDSLSKINALALSYVHIGKELQERKERAKAYEAYLLALEIDRNNSIALERIGLLGISLGKCNEAIIYLKKGLETNQLQDGRAENAIGACYLLENDFTNACQYFHLAKEKGLQNVEKLINTYCADN
jgi:O-antigen ligase